MDLVHDDSSVKDEDEESDDENDSKLDVTNDQVDDTGILIAVGKKFSSFNDLERNVALFEAKNFVKFWKREARTIEAARKRVDRNMNPKLKYYELKYSCIHGGQKFRPKGKENRNTS